MFPMLHPDDLERVLRPTPPARVITPAREVRRRATHQVEPAPVPARAGRWVAGWVSRPITPAAR